MLLIWNKRIAFSRQTEKKCLEEIEKVWFFLHYISMFIQLKTGINALI